MTFTSGKSGGVVVIITIPENSFDNKVVSNNL